MRTATLLAALAALACSCNSKEPSAKSEPDINTERKLEGAELARRGEYIMTTSLCHDCHSPKKMTPQGPIVDSARLLSGHPAGMPQPPIDKAALTPGGWVLMGPDITSFVGPWGISYAANLTPDTATGLGNWTEEMFLRTLRTGKHMGMDNGRPILPPMPWEFVGKMTDEDLRAVFAYLKSLPAINNRVPAPVPPNEVK
jgi:hypothetical protein